MFKQVDRSYDSKSFRMGPFGVLVATALWMAVMSCITSEQIHAALTGDIVETYYDRYCVGNNTSAAKARFGAFTVLTGLTFAYLALVSRFIDRSKQSARVIFFAATVVLCLLQLPFLISASSLLLQYIRCEGVTRMRLAGVVYSLLGCAALFWTCGWAGRLFRRNNLNPET